MVASKSGGKATLHDFAVVKDSSSEEVQKAPNPTTESGVTFAQRVQFSDNLGDNLKQLNLNKSCPVLIIQGSLNLEFTQRSHLPAGPYYSPYPENSRVVLPAAGCLHYQ